MKYNDIPKSVRIMRIMDESPSVKTFVLDYEGFCSESGCVGGYNGAPGYDALRIGGSEPKFCSSAHNVIESSSFGGSLGRLNSLVNSQVAKPGQFVNVWIPDVDEKPMSVAYCDDMELWITVCAVGPFSRAMHELKEGDMVGLRGPYGNGFSWGRSERLVMMAGGYGAAPLYFLTSEAVKSGCLVEFILGARSSDFLIYKKKLLGLENVNLYISTDDGSVGFKGYNTVILEKMIAESLNGNGVKVDMDGNLVACEDVAVKPIDCVYACGPEMMMKKVSDICFENEIRAEVSIERYMKCGFGVCGQCCLDDDGEPVCKKGPVFDNVEARKIKEFGAYHRDAQGKRINF